MIAWIKIVFSLHNRHSDSIIYLARRGMDLLPTGPLLGDLTSEVGHGEKIIQLVCLGPKNYAYVVKKADGSTNVVIKCKGITLNAKALDLLTIGKLAEIAEQYCMDPDPLKIKLRIEQTRISADPKHQTVKQQNMWKVYQAVSEKRMIIGNDTLPFGWVDNDVDVISVNDIMSSLHDPSDMLNRVIAFMEIQ